MKYEFILNHLDEGSISSWCSVLDVSRPGFYSWKNRPLSQREQSNQQLDKKIQNKPVAPNRLAQDFTATHANEKWVSDITYCWTQSGWLYLAVVMDLFSRKIIGWSMSNRMKKELVCDTLLMALWRRSFPKNVIVHSDRGSQYCSDKYQKLLSDNHLLCSMSGKGNCYDNSAMERFFHSLKVECLYDEYFLTREDAKQTLFEYVETYYNRERRHSTIQYMSPDEYEYNFLNAS